MSIYVGTSKEVAETISNYKDNNDLILIPTIWCADDIIQAIGDQPHDNIRDSFNAMGEEERLNTIKSIMQQIQDNFDAILGVNWDVIETNIINYFQ